MPKSVPSTGDLVVIGLDTEYVAREGKNHILTYQWHVIAGRRECSGIAHVDGKRMKLAALLQRILGEAKRAGLFGNYPKSVVVAAHYSLAEIVALRDFEHLKRQLDGTRRTFTSVKRPLKVKIRDPNGNSRPITVVVRDTMLLTPQGASLEALGEAHGIGKVTLPPGVIERMDLLLQENPALCERYALRDAEITARHALAMATLNHELTGRLEVPVSLGGLGVEFALRTWEQNAVNARAVLGTEVSVQACFDPRTGRTRKVTNVVSQAVVHDHQILATESYHGGRNEAFCFGATALGEWQDVDLAGAYSTALALMGLAQWDHLRVTTAAEDFSAQTIGVARLRFNFPTTVRYPCMPVRSLNNLIFPQAGTTHATGAEIELARRLGAEVSIIHGVVVPMDFGVRPFLTVIEEATRRRRNAKARGDVLNDKLFKELSNSLYGKTAQGLQMKRVFDTRLGRTAPMPESKLTNPFVASFVTGLIRAILGEMMNACPPDRQIVSVTTDGMITDATAADLQAMTVGPLCQRFAKTRCELVGDPTVVEIKHTATQVLCWRTRGQATIKGVPGAPILAKAGLKTPRAMDKDEQNDWILDVFEGRDIASVYEFKNLRSLSQIYKHGGDLVSEICRRRLRMDYDWKRQPCDPRMTDIKGIPHLAFDSVPWNSSDDFIRCREEWERFQDQTGHCLKTVEDLRAFEEFRAAADLNRHGLRRSAEGLVGAALRQFLRAFVRDAWGLNSEAMTYPALSEFLTSGGYATKVDAIKNAGRGKLVENAIPPDKGVEDFISYVKSRFPTFEAQRMLSDLPTGKPTQNRGKEYPKITSDAHATLSSEVRCVDGVLQSPWVGPSPGSTPANKSLGYPLRSVR